MIGYYGFRGAGKTLSLVVDLYAIWKKDPSIIVISNTPMDFGIHPKTKTRLNFFLYNKIDELSGFMGFCISERERIIDKMTYVVIDETGVVLPSRFFQKIPQFMLAFLMESRKINVEILFTVQHPTKTDKVLRELTEFWRYCSRTPLLGWIKQTEEELDPASCTVVKEYRKRFVFFPRKYYKFYDSYYFVGMDEALSGDIEAMKPHMREFVFKTYPVPADRALPDLRAQGLPFPSRKVSTGDTLGGVVSPVLPSDLREAPSSNRGLPTD